MNKNPKILIIGSTGKLGTKLLKYCQKIKKLILLLLRVSKYFKLKSKKKI